MIANSVKLKRLEVLVGCRHHNKSKVHWKSLMIKHSCWMGWCLEIRWQQPAWYPMWWSMMRAQCQYLVPYRANARFRTVSWLIWCRLIKNWISKLTQLLKMVIHRISQHHNSHCRHTFKTTQEQGIQCSSRKIIRWEQDWVWWWGNYSQDDHIIVFHNERIRIIYLRIKEFGGWSKQGIQ